MQTISHQVENINKEIQIVFLKNQMEIIELQNIITKMKNPLETER